MGETTFYSVRIDKPGSPQTAGWFLVLDLEQDPYPAQVPEPAVKWVAHKLEIDVPADVLTGSTERRVGDLIVVRSYVRAGAT